MHTLSMMKALELLCEGLGIQLIQGFFHKRCWSNIMAILRNENLHSDDDIRKTDTSSMPDYQRWLKDAIKNLHVNSRIGAGRGKDLYTLAIEGDDIKPHGHPGEKTQVIFADMLYDRFTS